MRLLLRKTIVSLAIGSLLGGFFAFSQPQTAFAAASLSVSSANTVSTGSSLTVSIIVSTGGQSANAFQGTFSYPTSLFQGISGSYGGSICTLPIVTPNPSNGTATFSCGTPGGFNGTGTVATITLKAVAEGTGNLTLSGCQVLANDGQGTNITGGCGGKSVTTTGPNIVPTTPPPDTPPVNTPPPSSGSSGGNTGGTTGTPRPTSTPRPTATPDNRNEVAAEQPNTPPPTDEPEAPPVASLPPDSGEPSGDATSDEGTVNEPRTIGQAIQDIFSSSRDFSALGTTPAGLIALMVTTIPFLGLVLAIVFLAYRLYLMERRRRKTLDRLFEMELAELAALEGKLDLLGEKGVKGREQYREEFKKVKENILRQLKPDYGKPVDGTSGKPPAQTPETPKK